MPPTGIKNSHPPLEIYNSIINVKTKVKTKTGGGSCNAGVKKKAGGGTPVEGKTNVRKNQRGLWEGTISLPKPSGDRYEIVDLGQYSTGSGRESATFLQGLAEAVRPKNVGARRRGGANMCAAIHILHQLAGVGSVDEKVLVKEAQAKGSLCHQVLQKLMWDTKQRFIDEVHGELSRITAIGKECNLHTYEVVTDGKERWELTPSGTYEATKQDAETKNMYIIFLGKSGANRREGHFMALTKPLLVVQKEEKDRQKEKERKEQERVDKIRRERLKKVKEERMRRERRLREEAEKKNPEASRPTKSKAGLSIMTWNMNKASTTTLQAILNKMETEQIDVACLQETEKMGFCKKQVEEQGFEIFHNDQVAIVVTSKLSHKICRSNIYAPVSGACAT
jgi:hypothetical protein